MEIRHIAEFMANEAKNEFLGGFFMENISEQMSGDVFQALEKFWDPLYGQGRAPKRVEKANFPNFEVTFLEILTCRTKTDAGFGISGPKLLGNGIARSILEQQVKFCCLV